MTTPTITTVRLTDLILDDAIQPRRRLDQGKIAEYADLYTAGVELPPIAVFMADGVCYVADGFHRTRAATTAGLETIPATVHEGTKRDAILYACTANSTHGVPLTTEDKWRVVTRMLEECREWSDNAIAHHCGVAHTFVAKVRGSLEPESSEPKPRTYRTKQGVFAYPPTRYIPRLNGSLLSGSIAQDPLNFLMLFPKRLIGGSGIRRSTF